MKIRYNLDTKSYTQKPTDAAAIRTRLCTAERIVETDPAELLDAIEKGQTFTPAEMTGTKGSTWQSQQIIVADIDNEKDDKCISRPLTPDTALSILDYNGIKPYCMYYSFRNKAEHPKFRIMVILSEPIRDAAESVELTDRLADIFNKFTSEKCADTAIADTARIIYGSTPGSVFYKSGEFTPLETLRSLPPIRQPEPPKKTTEPDWTNGLPADQKYHDKDILIEALSYIDPDASYESWTQCGMALKAEGFSYSIWETWSKSGSKFKEGECERKWETFSASGAVKGGTIIYYAQKRGFSFPEKPQKEHVSYEKVPLPGDKDAPEDRSKQDVSSIPEKEKEDPAIQESHLTSLKDFAEFMKEIQSDRFEPISTGIEQLDKALSGGLERKTLVTLAAAPGAGKTAIAQYLLENMAYEDETKKGHNVVYVNLEMDRSQLLSRSIARLSHERSLSDQRAVPNTRNHLPQSVFADINAIDVRRGYEWTDVQRTIVEKTAEDYLAKIAPHFQYVTTNPENRGSIKDNKLSSILGKLEAITAELISKEPDEAKKKHAAPLVCIDYLQFVEYDLMGENERKPDNAEAIKQTLREFKQFAMKYNTVVILITANNRASNSEGRASMDSARDTSNIEYSGDVMLSLVYTAVEERWQHKVGEDRLGNDKCAAIDNDFVQHVTDWTLRESGEYPLIAKLLTLKVVKGRSIMSRRAAKFLYDGKYFYFEPDTGYKNPYWHETEEEPV